MDTILRNLRQLKHPPIALGFGSAIRFAEDNGVLLPAIEGTEDFMRLRCQILQGITDTPRRQQAHITLLHPRNATCTDTLFAQVQQAVLPTQIHFDTISLIEQMDGGPWQLLEQFALGEG